MSVMGDNLRLPMVNDRDVVHVPLNDAGYIDTPWGTIAARATLEGIEIEVYKLMVTDSPVASMLISGAAMMLDGE